MLTIASPTPTLWLQKENTLASYFSSKRENFRKIERLVRESCRHGLFEWWMASGLVSHVPWHSMHPCGPCILVDHVSWWTMYSDSLCISTLPFSQTVLTTLTTTANNSKDSSTSWANPTLQSCQCNTTTCANLFSLSLFYLGWHPFHDISRQKQNRFYLGHSTPKLSLATIKVIDVNHCCKVIYWIDMAWNPVFSFIT